MNSGYSYTTFDINLVYSTNVLQKGKKIAPKSLKHCYVACVGLVVKF